MDTDTLRDLGLPDPSRFYYYFDDFDKFTAAEWTVGGVGAPTRTLNTGLVNGLVDITTSANANDNSWISSPAESFTIRLNRKTFFRARFSVGYVTQLAFAIGIQLPVAANQILNPTRGFFFVKQSGTLAFDFSTRNGGA